MMQPKMLIPCLIALAVLNPLHNSSAYGADIKAPFTSAPENKAQRFQDALTKEFQTGSFHGNALAAADGKVIYRGSFGNADNAKKQPLTADSVFDIASITKQFTAVALLQLQKQGKLTLSEPLAKSIPELAFYPEIT